MVRNEEWNLSDHGRVWCGSRCLAKRQGSVIPFAIHRVDSLYQSIPLGIGLSDIEFWLGFGHEKDCPVSPISEKERETPIFGNTRRECLRRS